MKVFNCILGVFSVLGAIYCMFYPGLTFLSTGWLITILLGVIGFCSIFEYATREDKNQGKGLIADGVLGLICGIGSAVVSVLGIFSPAVRGWLDMIMLMLFTFWLAYSGVTSIFKAVSIKKNHGRMWGFTLALGIITLIVGLYGAIHPLVTAFTIGYIIGVELMIYGVRLIASLFEEK